MTEMQALSERGVVSANGVSWKPIPGYVAAYAGTNGEIRYINSTGKLIKSTTVEWKTTKGTYLYVKVINDSYDVVKKAVHQLVALTYYGPPPSDGRVYEPNHIDGDKHNNTPRNLEWSTRSKNVQHAYDSGLTTGGIRVQAINVLTGDEHSYGSISKMSRVFGITRQELRRLVLRHRNEPYNGEWLFIVDDSSDKKLKRYQSCPVVFKDYITGTVMIAGDYISAENQTGIKHGTIRYRVTSKQESPLRTALLSRYVFQKLSDQQAWPRYTPEEATASEKRHCTVRELLYTTC